jgi:hypothetical protein
MQLFYAFRPYQALALHKGSAILSSVGWSSIDICMKRMAMMHLAVCSTIMSLAVLSVTAAAHAADPVLTPKQIFERRLVPIFKSPNPSSCTQCHLAGVDLKNYILSSSEKTFLSLRDQGLIDLRKPSDSKILRLINMSPTDRKGADLIVEKTRMAESEAFAEWIKACCADPKLRDAPKLDDSERAGPARPLEVVRHARKDRLLESFERNIWAMRFRCMSCHIEGTADNDKKRAEFGDRVAWFKKAGPEATMNYLIRETKLINVEQPEKSPLLLKPLNEVKHGGGKKFLPGDQGYKAFRAWLEDYAAIVKGRYKDAADLPPSTNQRQFGSDIWLKVNETPPEWGDKLLAVRVYAWDATKRAWEKDPIAFSDRGVWGKGKLWQHNLTLTAARESGRAKAWKTSKPSLPAGRYLIRIFVDKSDRLSRDWKSELGTDDYVGEAEITSRWTEGYGSMTVLDARKVKR